MLCLTNQLEIMSVIKREEKKLLSHISAMIEITNEIPGYWEALYIAVKENDEEAALEIVRDLREALSRLKKRNAERVSHLFECL